MKEVDTPPMSEGVDPSTVLDVVSPVLQSCSPAVLGFRTSEPGQSCYASCCQEGATDVNIMYDRVFCPELPLYNDHSGNIQCHINIGQAKPPPNAKVDSLNTITRK